MTWTTHDLELYADGELDPDVHDALTDELRRDHRLRARLTAVTRRDALVVKALSDERRAARRRTTWRRPAAAAGLAFAATAVAAYLWWRPSEAPERPAESGGYDPIRVVISLPVAEPEIVEPAPLSDDDFGAALARGDVEEALAMLADATDDERDRCYRRIGALLLTASAAEAVLDRLPSAMQVEACRHWVGDGHLRRVAFVRLSALAGDAQVGDEVGRVIDGLAAEPRYQPWVRSYFPGYQL